MKNYYYILGISSNSTKQEIQKSFRNLAKKYHPDVNKDNLEIEKKFKEIKEAYEILKDDVKREQYDKTLNKNNKKSEEHKIYNERIQKGTFEFSDIKRSFESFLGFDVETGERKQGEKLKTRNPIDTTDLFEKFMGFKK